MRDTLIYIAIMIAVTNAVRVAPLLLIRGRIRSRYARSFLHYVPYATLAVMTFPAIMRATQVPEAGLAALAVGLASAWRGLGLFPVAAVCCATVFILECLIA